MEMKTTARGFAYYEFADEYGELCSIQKSSSATEECIWIGADRLAIKGFVPRGKPDPWTTLTTSDIAEKYGFQDVIGNQRMHLTREHVHELLPILQRFVETGEIVSPGGEA